MDVSTQNMHVSVEYLLGSTDNRDIFGSAENMQRTYKFKVSTTSHREHESIHREHAENMNMSAQHNRGVLSVSDCAGCDCCVLTRADCLASDTSTTANIKIPQSFDPFHCIRSDLKMFPSSHRGADFSFTSNSMAMSLPPHAQKRIKVKEMSSTDCNASDRQQEEKK
jgi:hypothetical protein